MEAKQYLEHNGINPKLIVRHPELVLDDLMDQFAEHYHQSKLDAITDEEENEIQAYGTNCYVSGQLGTNVMTYSNFKKKVLKK